MHRLEDRHILPDVHPRREPESADQAGGEVRQDVPEHVFGDDHVELVRIQDELHGCRIHDPVFELDGIGIVLRHLPAHFEEQALRVLQDVRLVDEGDLLSPVLDRILERIPADPVRPVPGDQHHGLRHGTRVLPHADVVLDPRVQAFGVLPHDDDIDIVVSSARHDRFRGTDVRIQVEVLAQRHVDGPEARSDGRRQGPLETEPVPLDRIERLLGQQIVSLLDRGEARVLPVPLQRGARRIQNPDHFLRDRRSDSVARYQGHRLYHCRSLT